MLDRTPKHRELQIGFKTLCEKLLTREGFLIMEAGWKQKSTRALQSGIDLLVKRPSDPATMVVEARFYRSRQIDPSLLRNALEEVRKFREARKAKSALLVMTADVDDGMRAEAQKLDIDIWGLPEIIALTAKTPTLADTLYDLLRDGGTGSADTEQFSAEMLLLDAQSPRSKARNEGQRLAAELDDIKPAREGARKFEQLCDKALRYLFSEQFQRWTTQVRPEDGSQRPDAIARLVPRHSFWVSIGLDFRCRYVVIFVHNGAEPITRGDILNWTTHLHTGALRTVALCVTRSAWDAGARRAGLEALRDEGKLLLGVTITELKEMLVAKDLGEEFNDILIEKAADFLGDLTS